MQVIHNEYTFHASTTEMQGTSNADDNDDDDDDSQGRYIAGAEARGPIACTVPLPQRKG